MGANESETNGSAGLERVNRSVFRRLLRQDDHACYTLDIDATQIVAEKREAHYTYKGEKGYMPMVGHIAELGLVVGHEFREGNTAPAARNLEFMQACERNMPKGKKITAVRADSAAYQATIFNWCEETGKVFAIGADQDAAVKAAIKAIPEGDWKTFRDGEIAETIHCMNKTNKAFRLIVMRRPRDQDLFEERSPWRYHAIASNRENEDAATTMEWYSKRGDHSENRIKDLKIGFGMDYMPCGTFAANAVFFSIGVLTYNLYLGFRSDRAWERMGALASADRALAAVPDGGQDRSPWSAGVFEDQRGHAGHVQRDPRALRARHAGRRPFQKPRDRLARPFSRSVTSEKPLTGKPRKKRLAKAKDDGQNRYRAARQRDRRPRVTQNGAENRYQPRTTAPSKSRSRILG